MNHLPQRKLNGGNDEYFTKESIAKLCAGNMLSRIHDYKIRLYIEPSAGGGVFTNILLKKNLNTLSYDLKPKGDNIIKKNFLKLDFKKEGLDGAVFIGNPPFGTCSNTAIQFFNKSAEIADFIAFILPKTFRKYSVHKKLNRYFHLKFDMELPKNSFIVNGAEHDVPAVFQIWERENKQRQMPALENKFIIWSNPKDADFAIRRVGGNAGKVFVGKNISNLNTNSNYFCKEKMSGVKDKLSAFDWSHVVNNTAGVRSLSKTEIYLALSK